MGDHCSKYFCFQNVGTFVPTGFVLPKPYPCWYVYSDLHIFYFRVLKMCGCATMIYNQIFCVLCYLEYCYPLGHLLSQWEEQCELLIIQCYNTNNVFLNIIFFQLTKLVLYTLRQIKKQYNKLCFLVVRASCHSFYSSECFSGLVYFIFIFLKINFCRHLNTLKFWLQNIWPLLPRKKRKKADHH